MSFIIKRKIKNAIYVYEVTSYRDKNGKPRNHQKSLGRLDKNGVLISRKRKLPAKIKEVITITKKFILEPVTHSAMNHSAMNHYLGDLRRPMGKISGLSSRHRILNPKSSEIFCAPKKSNTARPIFLVPAT